MQFFSWLLAAGTGYFARMPDVDDPQSEHVAPPSDARCVSQNRGTACVCAAVLLARVDLARVTARNIAIFTVLGLVGLLALGATLIVGLVLLLGGIAGAIGAALGGRVWIGDLVVGVVVLGVFVGGAWSD